jgi:hypothetical protein
MESACPQELDQFPSQVNYQPKNSLHFIIAGKSGIPLWPVHCPPLQAAFQQIGKA